MNTHTAAEYVEMFKQLLPPGLAWPRDEGTNIEKLLQAWANELARVEADGAALVAESYPGTAVALLDEWEEALGLPYECAPAPVSTAERQAALIARLTEKANPSRQFFINLAATLGYAITITEHFGVAKFGVSRFGAARFGTGLSRFVWEITTASGANDDLLECAIRRITGVHVELAHTELIFNFT